MFIVYIAGNNFWLCVSHSSLAEQHILYTYSNSSSSVHSLILVDLAVMVLLQ